MYALSSATAPWAPFTARPRTRQQRLSLRKLTVRAEAQENSEDRDSLAKQLGNACAPFAAALFLMAQVPSVEAAPVADTPESSFQSSFRRQKELGGKVDVSSFFKKAKETASKPVDSAKQSVDSKAPAPDPTQAVSNLVANVTGSAGKTAKPGPPQKASAPDEISTSQQQPDTVKSPTPQSQAKSDKKIEEYTKRSEAGDAPKPKLDPSIIFDDPQPKKSPGTETKLPEQPRPEPETRQLGKDSSGGKVQDTKSGQGRLDSFGGGPSGQSPSSKADKLVEKANEPNGILDFIQKGLSKPGELQSSVPDASKAQEVVQGALSEKLEAPQPSDLDEKVPESAPKDPNEPPPQPKPEPTPPSALGKDTAGDVAANVKAGADSLQFFGSAKKSPEAENADPLQPTAYTKTGNSGYVYLLAQGGQLEPPPPSEVDVDKAPTKIPEQPKPEPESKQLGTDTPGGETSDTKRGGSGFFDFFGGSESGDSDKAAEKNVQKATSFNPNNIVGDFAFEPKDAGPKLNESAQVAPQTAPNPAGIEKPATEDQKRQNIKPEQTKPEAAEGTTTTPSVSDAGFNSSSALPKFDEVALTAEQGPPPPTPADEPVPSSAPGEPNELPDQPKAEPASKQTPQDTPGGETSDTKRGGGPFDFFGGPDSGDSDKAAEKNIQKAASLNVDGASKVNEVAQTAEEAAGEGPDQLKATAIAIGIDLVLFIAILSTYGGEESAKHH